MNRKYTTLAVVALMVFAGCVNVGGVDRPGDAVKAGTVGSSTIDGQISDFSSRGPTADYRTKPEFVAPGEDVTSTLASNAANVNGTGDYANLSGTSMATPQVSGGAALLIQKAQAEGEDVNATGIKTALMAGATPLSERQVRTPIAESDHPYGNLVTTTYEVRHPGASQFRMHFHRLEVESGFDFVRIYDEDGDMVQEFTGNHSGEWSTMIDGDVATVELTTDSSRTDFGFSVDRTESAAGDVNARLVTNRRYSVFTQGSGEISVARSAARLNRSSSQTAVTPSTFATNRLQQEFTAVVMADDGVDDLRVETPSWVTVDSMPAAVPENGQVEVPMTVDASGEVSPVVDSEHPYENETETSWTITRSGADEMRLHFSAFQVESTWDTVTVYDADTGEELAVYSGAQGAFWTRYFQTDSVEIVFESDFSVNGHGFTIDAVQTGDDSEPRSPLPVTGTVEVYDGSEKIQEIPVTVKPAGIHGQFTAEFTPGSGAALAGQPVAFDAFLSSGEIESFEWEFDDGATASGEFVTHAFETPGDHEVTLTVTDADDGTETVTKTVTVQPGAGAAPEPDPEPARSTEVDVVLEGAPDGLQLYNVTLASDGATIADSGTGVIASGEVFAGGAGGTSITHRGADLSESVDAFSGDRVLFNVSYDEPVTRENLTLTVNRLTDDNSADMDPSRVSVRVGGLSLFSEPIPRTGADAPPTDPDGDGLYEDVDGDGDTDFEDAIALAFADSTALTPEQRDALDFDQDGDVDFDDAIELAFQVP